MSLETKRTKAALQLEKGVDLDREKEVSFSLEDWFKSLKKCEENETFERAFTENRMCARVAPSEQEPTKKQSFTPQSVRTPDDVKIQAAVSSLKLFMNPENFLQKKKNDLGLHDVSAVLLDSRMDDISKQLFSKQGRMPVFIPIPHEEDLQLFNTIAQVAKKNRKGPIYEFYKNARARLTRIKYGSPEDMKTTFLKFVDDRGTHYRYGDAHEQSGPVKEEILKQRRLDALHYKTKVLTGNLTDNNEVTLKIREHEGSWPQAAIQGPQKKMGPMPYEVPEKHFLLMSFDSKFTLINFKGQQVK